MSSGDPQVYDVDQLKEHHVRIMELINIPTLIPLLEKYRILSPNDLERVASVQRHGTIERTGFLLQSIYKRDQKTINSFIQCLREEKVHPGHQEIVNLLERGLPDLPDRSPLFDILESRMTEIAQKINITMFLNVLTNSGAIKVSAFLDLSNPDRRVRDNLERLIRVLEEKGNRGFIDFLSGLRKDPTPNHKELFRIIFKEVQAFLKEHSRRGEIPEGDKREILQLESSETALEQEVVQRFKKHFTRLISDVNVEVLLPLLREHHVLTEEDMEELGLTEREQRNKILLELIESKHPFWIVKFSECMKESPEHWKLSELLLPSPPASGENVKLLGGISHKNDKILLMVDMVKYVKVNEDYQISTYSPDDYVRQDRNFKQDREILRNHFAQANFKIIDFSLSINVAVEQPEVQPEVGPRSNVISHEQRLAEKFQTEVVSKCSEDAIIFIYICGIQFPYEHQEEFSGAILLAEASTVNRKEMDCLKVRDILRWLNQVPNAHVTILIDTEHDFVAKFGKQRQPEVVNIMTDPWSMLTTLNSSTVIYYLQPDVQAMAQYTDEDIKLATGMLTECFNFALLHCFVRKSKGQEIILSHQGFYEAISFYWHRRGRQHRLFVPAVRGDVSREFLGRSVFPYYHMFRVDMVRSDKKNELFDMDKLYIQPGTMAKISFGDELELFHILRPGIRVRGKVCQSHPLNSMVEIVGEGRLKLSEVVMDIYQDKKLRTKDGSTEFIFAVKIFPLHEKVAVFTEGLSDSEKATVKSYIEKRSPHLSHVVKETNSKIVVHKSGCYYFAEDKERDVKDIVKVKRLNLILAFLEMIAWFKYVKKLKSSQRPPLNYYSCFLTAEQPLLHTAMPLCEDFNIKWSSFEGAPPSSKGHEVIMQSAELPQTFWTPSPRDHSPCLEVSFKDNHVITSIELKGDIHKNKYVKMADVYHQRQVFNGVIEGPNKEHLRKEILFNYDEPVQFIIITPRDIANEKNFTISFKMMHMISSGTERVSREVLGVTVYSWVYHQQVGTGWKFTPSPDPNGYINLESGYHWITWTGSSCEPVTFDLGVSGVKLEKMEFAAISDSNYLNEFSLIAKTFWKLEKLPGITTPWPVKYEFPRPLVVSNIQLWPTSASPEKRDAKLQLQLYGNKQSEPMEVEEGDILSFHFNNFMQQGHLVYILCLEETGGMKFVMIGLAAAPYPDLEKKIPIYPVMKKLIQTYIPEDYSPELNQIKDTYKVFVCQRNMYIEPFIQRSLRQYNHPCCYSITGFGYKEMRKEAWYDFTFEVIVKKSRR